MSCPASHNAPPAGGTTSSIVLVPPASQPTNMIPYFLHCHPGTPPHSTHTSQPTEQRLNIADQQIRANHCHLEQKIQMLKAQNEQLMEEMEGIQTEISTAKSILYSATSSATHRTLGM